MYTFPIRVCWRVRLHQKATVDQLKKDATAACNSAFASYVGITYSKSLYTWTDIVPDASTWPGGDRGLHCVLYYATNSQPAGVTLHSTLKGSAK